MSGMTLNSVAGTLVLPGPAFSYWLNYRKGSPTLYVRNDIEFGGFNFSNFLVPISSVPWIAFLCPANATVSIAIIHSAKFSRSVYTSMRFFCTRSDLLQKAQLGCPGFATRPYRSRPRIHDFVAAAVPFAELPIAPRGVLIAQIPRFYTFTPIFLQRS